MIKPVYIFSGFLDAGKTSVIKETLNDVRFTNGEPTLIIAMEEGDEEYDEEFLNKTNSKIVYLSGLNELTHAQMAEFELDYDFERIFIELNGLENEAILYENGFIRNWDFAEQITLVDATKFKMQINNLRTFFFDHIRYANVCIFNRADEVDKKYIRNNLKAVNPYIQIIYEDNNGNISSGVDELPFDLEQDPLYIEDIDYGLWYMDALDHPDKYDNHNISLNMKYIEDIPHENDACIMGRRAMVCCANDITNIGITCLGINPREIKNDQYYRITGKIRCINDTQGYRTCLLYADKWQEENAPKDDLVNFN